MTLRQAALQLVATFNSNPLERRIIGAALLLNLLFIALHVFSAVFKKLGVETFLTESDRFRLERELGFAELFNYLQAFACVVLLARAFVLSAETVYLAWSLVFAFVLLDDSLALHERGGSMLDGALTMPAVPGLRAQDAGEMIVWIAAGILLLPLVIRGLRTSNPEAHAFGCLIGLGFALLLFFAVGMDMLHVAIGDGWRFSEGLLALIEDGGEMLSLGLICGVAILLNRRLSLQRAPGLSHGE